MIELITFIALTILVITSNVIVLRHSIKRGERFEETLLRLEFFITKVEAAVNDMARMTAESVHRAGIKDGVLPSPQQRALALVMRMERVGGREGADKRDYVVKSLQRHFPSMSVAAADSEITAALKAIQGRVL